MKPRIVADVLARPEVRRRLDGDVPAVVLYDLDALDAEVAALKAAFPPDTLHAVAMKAAPLPALLRPLVAAGLGLEVGSRVELAMALRLAPPDRIVHDGVAKVDVELDEALTAGVIVHADDLAEVARIGDRGPFGLRVNTGVGVGRVAATSTAMAGSAFGVDVTDGGADVLAAFCANPNLRGLHQHVGSLGFDVPDLVRGARQLADFAARIVAAGGHLDHVDIGGGLPVWTKDDGPSVAWAAYAEALRAGAPAVFERRLITEFGRRLFTKAGWVATTVHSTKRSGAKDLAIAHVGADLFVRAAYATHAAHRITVHHATGDPKRGEPSPWDVCGPLCFSGDRIARDRALVAPARGDRLVVHDAGAYTLGMWSRYNSRPSPAVLGHRADGSVTVLRESERIADVAAFWEP